MPCFHCTGKLEFCEYDASRTQVTLEVAGRRTAGDRGSVGRGGIRGGRHDSTLDRAPGTEPGTEDSGDHPGCPEVVNRATGSQGEGPTDLLHRSVCCALALAASRFSKSNASRTTARYTGPS